MRTFAEAGPALVNFYSGAIYGIFVAYVAISFFRVAWYSAARMKAGQLIGTENAPRRWTVAGWIGWSFVLGVLLLLFDQSPLYLVLVVAGISIFLLENRGDAVSQFGLNRLSVRQVILWPLLLCGAVLFIEFPLGALIDKLMTAIRLPHPEQVSVEIFRQAIGTSKLVFFMVQAVILSPFIEELFFRGFLFTFLKNYTTTIPAIVLSAGVFAFAHANLGSVLQLWFLGIVLAVAYEHTGSLLLPIGVHALWNFFTAMSLLLDPGAS